MNDLLARLQKKYVDCGEIHLPKSQFKPFDTEPNDHDNEEKKENDKEQIHRISVVHISDTHQKHMYMNDNIPSGDILVHTGDFL